MKCTWKINQKTVGGRDSFLTMIFEASAPLLQAVSTLFMLRRGLSPERVNLCGGR